MIFTLHDITSLRKCYDISNWPVALVSGFVLGFKNYKLAIELFNPKTGGGVELENGFKIYRRGGFMFSDYNNASLVL